MGKRDTNMNNGCFYEINTNSIRRYPLLLFRFERSSKMRLFIFSIMSIFFLCGCDNKPMSHRFLSDIKYVKDKKSDICFAYYVSPTYSLSAVPCEKVEHLLEN